jgi:hypothetical protein
MPTCPASTLRRRIQSPPAIRTGQKSGKCDGKHGKTMIYMVKTWENYDLYGLNMGKL